MFAWIHRRRAARELRDLQRRYLVLLEESRDLQRKGDIQAFAAKTAEAEAVGDELDRRTKPAASQPA